MSYVSRSAVLAEPDELPGCEVGHPGVSFSLSKEGEGPHSSTLSPDAFRTVSYETNNTVGETAKEMQ